MEENKIFADKICINCNKYGHTSRNCKYPITSYGILLYRKKDIYTEFLMICRKDTFNFVEFICGRYNIYDSEYILHLLNNMTINERQLLLDYDFNILWNNLWMKKNQDRYSREFFISERKFNTLKRTNLKSLIEKVETKWEEPEWGFPKGRRNFNEKEKECAIREFEEETNLKNNNYSLLDYEPIEEIFYGSNGTKYRHIYYIAKANIIEEPLLDINNINQITEISDIKWFSFEECIKKIRPYNTEKIEMFYNFYKKIE